MFHDRAAFIQRDGDDTRNVLRTTLYICSAIKSENRLAQRRRDITLRGWPVSPDFVALNDFTWSLEADIAALISDRGVRAEHIVWKSFLDCLSQYYKENTEEACLHAFTRDRKGVSSSIYIFSTAGFYGPKGEHIIAHALEGMFRTSTLPLNTIRPLDVKKFTDFILVPYVATSAIAHRFGITIAEAHTIRLDSRSAGIDLHPALDSDEELDQIYRTNIQRSKSNTRVAIHDNQSSKGGPPRLRRATLQLIEVLSFVFSDIH